MNNKNETDMTVLFFGRDYKGTARYFLAAEEGFVPARCAIQS